MILTEEEARGKWCPYSRVIFNHRDEAARMHAATSYNRSSDPMPLSNCLGSGCMAWDWVEGPDKPARRGTCGMQGTPHTFDIRWNRSAEREGELNPPAEPTPPVAPSAQS